VRRKCQTHKRDASCISMATPTLQTCRLFSLFLSLCCFEICVLWVVWHLRTQTQQHLSTQLEGIFVKSFQIVKKIIEKKKINVKKRKNPKEATAEGNRRGLWHRGGKHPPWEVSVAIRSSIQCRELKHGKFSMPKQINR